MRLRLGSVTPHPSCSSSVRSHALTLQVSRSESAPSLKLLKPGVSEAAFAGAHSHARPCPRSLAVHSHPSQLEADAGPGHWQPERERVVRAGDSGPGVQPVRVRGGVPEDVADLNALLARDPRPPRRGRRRPAPGQVRPSLSPSLDPQS
eukprot:2329883-Rhodomonas_salina.3